MDPKQADGNAVSHRRATPLCVVMAVLLVATAKEKP